MLFETLFTNKVYLSLPPAKHAANPSSERLRTNLNNRQVAIDLFYRRTRFERRTFGC
jgi:hypothetical protein